MRSASSSSRPLPSASLLSDLVTMPISPSLVFSCPRFADARFHRSSVLASHPEWRGKIAPSRDKPISRIQSDTRLRLQPASRHLRSLSLSLSLSLSPRKGAVLRRAGDPFFGRGLNLNAQRKSAHIPRVRSSSSARPAPLIAAASLMTPKRGGRAASDRGKRPGPPPPSLCKERNVEIDDEIDLTDGLRKKENRFVPVTS